MKDKGFSLLTVIVIVCLTSIVSAITVGVIITNNYKGTDGITYTNLIKDENLKEFLDVYESVLTNYYKDVNKQEMLEKAINAMLNYLGDNYTTYLTKEQREALTEKLEGSYKGIGITIANCTIQAVNENSPAAKAGLQVGDVIIKVDNKDFTECVASDVASEIKNTNKKVVKIKVLRNNKEQEFNIELKTILISQVDYHLLENTDIGYINISVFSNTINEQFTKALTELQKQGMKKLIIDVRNNTGGYLDGAKDIASQILPEGKLIFTLDNKDGKTAYYDETATALNIPVVVLINGSSASSAEILTAALKDSYGATLIGTKTYGKGKVQQTYALEDGSMAKYTSALWLRPNGECIDGKGIVPDIEVPEPETETETDVVLNRAIEYLN